METTGAFDEVYTTLTKSDVIFYFAFDLVL